MAAGSMPRMVNYLRVGLSMTALTGLRIGGQDSSIAIGGPENVIIRDPLTGQPYVPGSSIKGKMRSLLERVDGKVQNTSISSQVYMHACKNEQDYAGCLVCQLFGVAPQGRWFCQTRLRFRDIFLEPESEKRLREADLDLPYTEVKSEASIDRLTSAAVPRQMERVPAGAVFGPASIGMFVYEGDDVSEFLGTVTRGLELLEADYVGGTGSRGSGRVSFTNLKLEKRDFRDPAASFEEYEKQFAAAADMRQALSDLAAWAR